MTVQVSPAKGDEIREVLRIMFQAYDGQDVYIDAVFPRGLTDEGLNITYQRCLSMTEKVPGIRWEKAIDATTGKIVGGSMWTIFENTKPARPPLDGPPGTWENEIDKEFAQVLFNKGRDDENMYWADKELPIMSMCWRYHAYIPYIVHY
jgi:hypothetical protein